MVFADIGLIIYYWLRAIVLFFVPKSWRLKDVSKDTVLITGAGNGLGRLLAIRFATKADKVIICDIDEKGLNETKQLVTEVGCASCYAYVCDVSNRIEIEEMANKVLKDVGYVTILVNNAGIVNGKKFGELKPEQIELAFKVNVLSHFWTCKAFLPAMIEADYGHVVSISSVTGLFPVPSLTDYCSSKYAVVGFFETLYTETKLENSNINFTLVCPYHVNTGMFAGMGSTIIPSLEPDYVADQIMNAVLTNQEILIMPKFFYFTLFLKSLMPMCVGPYILRLMNGHTAMDTFVGHHSNDKKKK